MHVDSKTGAGVCVCQVHVPVILEHSLCVPAGLFPGCPVPVQLPAVWSLPGTFSKCVETALEMKGPVLSGRPVANGTVAGRGGGADGQACRTPVSPGFYGELEEEHSSPLPEAYLFGCGVGLLSMESASLSLSQERLDALTELLRRVVPLTVVTALSITRLLGLMSVAHVVVPP